MEKLAIIYAICVLIVIIGVIAAIVIIVKFGLGGVFWICAVVGAFTIASWVIGFIFSIFGR